MTIYIDVLIIINLYINYFLLSAAGLLLRRKISKKRRFFSALFGAAASLIILAPPLGIIFSAIFKIFIGAAMTFIAFGRQKVYDFFVCWLCFLLVSFIFAGIMAALWNFSAPLGMASNNGVFTFDIPIAALAAFTAAAYFAVSLVKRLFCRKEKRFCNVKIYANGAEITLRGLCDTGCEICDIITRKPVLVCALEKAKNILPADIPEYFAGKSGEKLRLLPCKTLGGEALLPVFNAEKVEIDGKSADVVIGISRVPLGDDFDCVFDPRIIPI